MISFLDPRVWVALVLASALGYGGGRFHQWRADVKSAAAAQLTKTEQARETERELQRFNQGAQNVKDAEYRRIAARLSDALRELRSRPDRLPEAARTACEGSSGKELAGPDAGFLSGYSADAARLQADYDACSNREWAAFEALR